MRYPLPLHEMRAAILSRHRGLVAQAERLGCRDVWSEVWLGFARRTKPFDPARMRSPAAWVQAIGKCILINIIVDHSRQKRTHNGEPERTHGALDAALLPCAYDTAEADVLDLLDLADDLGVTADALAAVSVGWTAAETAGALGLTVEQVRDVLRARVSPSASPIHTLPCSPGRSGRGRKDA